ncbi:MAG TPA: 1-deoxy-D-xylulose-5-phosphate synthase, partial [Thermodesulfobacteriota bacterium]
DTVGDFLKNLPAVGDQVARLAKKTEEAAKGLVGPGTLFEELGFKYLGPVPGHDYAALIDTLQNVKALREPVLVHVITKKGKGFAAAEGDPIKYHGVAAGFDAPKKTDPAPAASPGPARPPVLTYTQAFVHHLVALARRDPRIVAITAAMPDGTGLDRFQVQFPNRCFDVGIAEQHAVCFAAGLAAEGMRPVAAIYSTFLQRAYDQIIHDVAIQRLPVTFALDRGGLVGADGATHHGVFDYGYLRIVPNLVVMAPKDENELGRMLRTAVDLGGPASVRYPRGKGLGVPLDEEPSPIPVGEAEVLVEGDDLAVVAIGQSVSEALVAASRLAADGIRATVVNARFVKPLDLATLERVARRTGRLLTVEDHVRTGGFGTAVLEALGDLGLAGEVAVVRLGVPDRFIEHGTQEEQRAEVGIDAAGIERAARALVAAPARPAAGRGALRLIPPR